MKYLTMGCQLTELSPDMLPEAYADGEKFCLFFEIIAHKRV